jgi:hypothetical protein
MTDITELALIAKIKKQTENFDTVVLKEWEAPRAGRGAGEGAAGRRRTLQTPASRR